MAMALRLQAGDVRSFRENGYLLYHRQVFGPRELSRLEGIFAEHLAASPHLRPDELDTPHFADARLLEFLLSPEVLDLVEPILGPDIILWSSHFIGKEPRVGRATPWHEDSAYWKGRLDRYDAIVTVWLALDDSTPANGCVRVIAGSHGQGGFSAYRPADSARNTFTEEIAGLEPAQAVDLSLGRGECSLHDGRIIHGARPNTSDRRRLGYTMRYISAATRVIHEASPGHRLWLARGRPVAPNTYENVR